MESLPSGIQPAVLTFRTGGPETDGTEKGALVERGLKQVIEEELLHCLLRDDLCEKGSYAAGEAVLYR
ncbi:hypothetical protein [Thermodesulfitimonas autotrophica]|uniref:hypothetical protein n=1 Tax=Thermodesulfitimonas autotrophica TaxID=1894989 RepID=UPI000F4F49E0|nr:hypothetical protein [Thermodesulfitimonas autotrophica]